MKGSRTLLFLHKTCVTSCGHGHFLALCGSAGQFVVLIMKQLFIAAVTQIYVTLWGHGHLLALWGHAGQFVASISKELFIGAVAQIWVTL